MLITQKELSKLNIINLWTSNPMQGVPNKYLCRDFAKFSSVMRILQDLPENKK